MCTETTIQKNPINACFQRQETHCVVIRDERWWCKLVKSNQAVLQDRWCLSSWPSAPVWIEGHFKGKGCCFGLLASFTWWVSYDFIRAELQWGSVNKYRLSFVPSGCWLFKQTITTDLWWQCMDVVLCLCMYHCMNCIYFCGLPCVKQMPNWYIRVLLYSYALLVLLIIL